MNCALRDAIQVNARMTRSACAGVAADIARHLAGNSSRLADRHCAHHSLELHCMHNQLELHCAHYRLIYTACIIGLQIHCVQYRLVSTLCSPAASAPLIPRSSSASTTLRSSQLATSLRAQSLYYATVRTIRAPLLCVHHRQVTAFLCSIGSMKHPTIISAPITRTTWRILI